MPIFFSNFSGLSFNEWTEEDRKKALEQNWEIYRLGIQLYILHDLEPIFKNNEEALNFVITKAKEGDELCIKAVTLLAKAKLSPK